MPSHCVILGAGYTGRRVASILESRGRTVLTTTRSTLEATQADTVRALAEAVQPGACLLHSIPLITSNGTMIRPTPLLLPILERAGRIVYLSTTGVYGATHEVNEATPAAPRTPRECLRVEEEQDIAALCANTLVLRPAAIYGPGRGVHAALRQGRHKVRGDGSNYISRIHVDDLAALAAAAIESTLTGAFPVADREPCPAIEITRYCAQLLGVPAPEPTAALPSNDTRSSNRRVDGSAVFHRLGVQLRYPDYRSGTAAAIAAEQRTEASPRKIVR